ncbi:MAG: S8 family serine peptidase, partial [Planctomycetota bacterium]
AMNPGLGVRALHQQGFTGAGVSVAIIDHDLFQDHPEFAGKVAAYHDLGEHDTSMHGPAVASLLVGSNCGTAPDAQLYYVSCSQTHDTNDYAEGLDWIVEQNESLPQSQKIRVVSISAAPGGPLWTYREQYLQARERAEAAGILVIDCTDERGFTNRGWYDPNDPENIAKFTAAVPGYPPSGSFEGIYFPVSRSMAEEAYEGDFSYLYTCRGGSSWTVPYCAGVLAMGWQIRPELTKGQMVDCLFETAYVNPDGAKIINPPAFVNFLQQPILIYEFDDVCNQDLSECDFSNRPGLIDTLTFNQDTIWPEPNKMPPGCDPNVIMANAMNPGLGVRALHQQGITGAGINVAIIDQPILQTHPEYNGKIAAYYDAGCGGSETSMHGPAMTSLLVGENCGTAPDAEVYYVAAPSWFGDAAYYADALDWIVTQNESLPASDKIRVVSVSAQPSGLGSLYSNQEMWDAAVANAQSAGILVLDCTWHHGFVSLCWYDANDPENISKCTPGFRDGPVEVDAGHIHAPTAPRTQAEEHSEGNFGYIYGGGSHRSSRPNAKNGYSDAIPYCAGVLAMAWQVKPELTKEQMVDLLFLTAYVNGDGAQIINPPAFINLLVENKPAIQLSNDEFEFYADSNDPNTESQTLSIANSGLATLNWVISYDCNWLDVDPNAGSSTGKTDINDVTLSITALPVGIHNCELTISDPCATNSPQTVLVTLYVSNANASIQDAIDAAEEGDTVIIEPGVYMGDGNRDLDFKGKAITVRGIDPDDPDV